MEAVMEDQEEDPYEDQSPASEAYHTTVAINFTTASGQSLILVYGDRYGESCGLLHLIPRNHGIL
jgi:hypothetical protein